MHSKILTFDNLQKKDEKNDPMCKPCNTEQEKTQDTCAKIALFFFKYGMEHYEGFVQLNTSQQCDLTWISLQMLEKMEAKDQERRKKGF